MNCKTAQQYIQLELDGELSERHKTALEQHLSTCRSCRQVRNHFVALQSAMGDLAARSQTAALPSVDFGQTRAMPWRSGLAAAAAIALLLSGWWMLPHGQLDVAEPIQVARSGRSSESAGPQLVERTRPTETSAATDRMAKVSVGPDPRSLVRVTFEHDEDYIALPIKTENPNVSIIWIYPTIKTADNGKDENNNLSPSSSKELNDANHTNA